MDIKVRKASSLDFVFHYKPCNTRNHPGHKIFAFLLKDLAITWPNQVWAAEITNIPMSCGFMYLVIIMDWHCSKILSWWISNSRELDFCVEALQGALSRFGLPDIFNTDQSSQFTCKDFTGALKEHQVKISMDGRGRCHDRIFIERLRWIIKYQYLHLHSFENGLTLRCDLAYWISGYDHVRNHSSLDYREPDEDYPIRSPGQLDACYDLFNFWL